MRDMLDKQPPYVLYFLLVVCNYSEPVKLIK